MKIRSILVAFASSILFGCATTPKFSDVDFPKDDADLTILVTQEELRPEASDSSGVVAGGVLLGAVGGLLSAGVAAGIDAERNARAEDAIEPLRDSLIDYDLSERFVEHIQQSRVEERLVVGASPELRTDELVITDLELDRPLVLLVPEVKLSNDMMNLLVDLAVTEIAPRERDGWPIQGMSRTFRFMWPLETEENLDREEAVAVWSNHSAEDLMDLIERGMVETLRMMSAHLDEGELAFEDEDSRVHMTENERVWLWRESGEFTWLAHTSGRGIVYAVPDHAIIATPRHGYDR